MEVVAIAKDIIDHTEYYLHECGGTISDGEIYTGNIRVRIQEMQEALNRIDKMSKRFGGC